MGSQPTVVRRRLRISGMVQGVGFRPFVWHLAQQLGCSGWVYNDAAGVVIEVQGTAENLDRFRLALTSNPPPLSRIESLDEQNIVVEAEAENQFLVLSSQSSGGQSAFVSPDMATCVDCLREMQEPANRRYAYPFINCTHCGPRFTIQYDIPYDRQQTTMKSFPLCVRCNAEYHSPADRRFHAQPNACPECGPTIWLVENAEANGEVDTATPARTAVDVLDLVSRVRQLIAAGQTVAIKGLGGFHLACDAKNRSAVHRLRSRKRRPFKPLAVMVADLATARDVVRLDEAQAQLLASRERPIVLLRKHSAISLPEEVAPGNPYLGVLLPYTPLHHLLLQAGDVWVMTSGNLADEPIAYDNDSAMERLQELCDAFLMHDRPIHTVCDDSVVRLPQQRNAGKVADSQPVPIRRSRGYAPLPIALPGDGATVSAVGGELKTALCVAKGMHAFMSQHVGDMGNRETLLAMERAWEHLHKLYKVEPQVVAVDLHPGYLSTQWGERISQRLSVPLVRVQHHHAHAASLIAEHQLPHDQPIMACVFDGTGYGTDGAIWGGEFLLASAAEFRRIGCLRYARLPGGDRCIATPAKTTLAFLHDYGLGWSPDLAPVRHFTEQERKQVLQQLDRNINASSTSSMGRLFDVVASLLGICQVIDYEGQAAVELEAAAEEGFAASDSDGVQPYPFAWSEERSEACNEGQCQQLDLSASLEAIIADVQTGALRSHIAARWHETIAEATVSACVASRLRFPAWQHVGLTGGVFQNLVLLQRLIDKLERAGFSVLTHRSVPCNDGGLALGQAVVARALASLPNSFRPA